MSVQAIQSLRFCPRLLVREATLRSTGIGPSICHFSGNANGGRDSPPLPTAVEWRKKQLDKLERKFSEPSQVVDNDDDLQPMWREMESRVTRRRPRTIQESGGKTGRTNVKKTDEEMWLRGGLYDDKNKQS